ncbi:MAG: EamA family transporter [gamma proteobacterium symbiont of Bathyaustriella thionipta]|nr:EamA family transporter [gamma proteobacterium symbiont of Bathyaustriella thionipta]MCU7949761.1 EamA family transporter [gamma proteobacterium symbiont of Bathyaustriella thionipta]MCU7953002.1 EamA family transporter [gamma proteobacterium symbiont of Bathyaustriella thionipta]MCU7956356.1 EamA family transporter [gamma proteobacterium symbiont of Bathyaustriella thionipta]MCU7966461.1 EamA family transporter [gamma proteobacterium symbiont of Bathyaustriella thionipta]
MEYWLVFTSCVFTTLGQFLQKLGAEKINTLEYKASFFHKLFIPEIILGIIALGLGALSWLLVLSYMEVSKAYPLLSINFILMLFLARFYFNETIHRQHWFGVLFIMLGISLISQS